MLTWSNNTTLSTIFFLIFAPAALAADDKAKILVLHSYHQGMVWTDNISKGISSVFADHTDQYEVHFDYLDTKRHTGDEYSKKLLQFIQYKYSKLSYKAVIVSDNNALKILNDGLITFTGNPPIIFSGINNFTPELTEHLPNSTGVLERTDHRANIELMRRLHPEIKRITIIVDRTPTGDAIHRELQEVQNSFEDLQFTYFRDFTFREAPSLLASLNKDEPIYLLTFNRDSNNQFISYSEAIALIQKHTQAPLYGAWDFYMGKGLVGGSIVSGYLQGTTAAELTLEVLNNPEALAQPLISKTPTQYMFDYKYLIEHNIDLGNLPPEHILLNSPESLYQKYKKLLIGFTTISMLIVLVLIWRYSHQKALLKERLENNLQLEKTVSQRTQELESANKQLKKLSSIDALTQLYNRRIFDESLKAEVQRCQRDSKPLSLLLCDIDMFKKFNDSYGHLCGDECIKSVAEVIQDNCKRVSDVAARYGGEEFAAILPNTDEKGAVAVGQKIQLSLAAKAIPFENSVMNNQVTISVGTVTVRPQHETTPAGIIEMADKALYSSKHNGRNRITAYHSKISVLEQSATI